ncbi:MAG: DUF4167 domain-containing protein [Magnetospirillum sp.]|nr:DUF4167 domain-containing protein [Magnetospirillum sp.]
MIRITQEKAGPVNNPKQRSRGRGNPNGGGNPHGGGRPRQFGGGGRNQVFDSNGPEGRIRGNAHQVMERYLAMARDASSQGDRVAAENYYQHAEHYFRLLNAYNQSNGQRRPQNTPTPAEDQMDPAESDEDEEQAAGASDPEQGADGASEAVGA